ncbi:GNAT family N-acetyltransferase [Mesorhizobium sp. SP-1A]|uniref:GNAT family N-acetyltransferase n=1 Tax=Mesorhizobium sp. SP-1A TaxID=3077840 RepID=UPI0028F729A2|nr:GNAT family N-acetyltransferase [Mesorhizobium sp. SP-1A]
MAKITPEYTFTDGTAMYRRFVHEGPRSNRNLFERIKYLNVTEMQREQHFVCHTPEGKVIGDLALQQSPWEQNTIWLKHIAVDKAYQNQGIATELLKRGFEHVEAQGKILEFSSFSDEGKKYLKPLIQRLRADFPSLEMKLSDPLDDDMFAIHPQP